MSWSRREVSILIDEYKRWPNLYKSKSPQYKNRHMRNNALGSIQKTLAEIKPDITINEIQTKFQGLKTNFLRERKKQVESEKSGQGTDYIYEPTLWYYTDMFFLLDDIVPRQAIDSIDIEEGGESQDSYDENGHNYDVSPTPSGISEGIADVQMSQNTDIQIFDVIPSNSASNTPNRTKKRKRMDSDSILEKASGALDNLTSLYKPGNIKEKKSNNEIFGDFVAAKLGQITNDDVKNDTELEITKLLYEAIKKSKEAGNN